MSGPRYRWGIFTKDSIIYGANLTIRQVIEVGDTQKNTTYQCYMHCCAAVVTLTHAQIVHRKRNYQGNGKCAACSWQFSRSKPKHVEVVAAPVVPAEQPLSWAKPKTIPLGRFRWEDRMYRQWASDSSKPGAKRARRTKSGRAGSNKSRKTNVKR